MSSSSPADTSTGAPTFDDCNGSVDVAERLYGYIQPEDHDDFNAPVESLQHVSLYDQPCPLLELVDRVTEAVATVANSPTAADGTTVQTTDRSDLIQAFVIALETELPRWFDTADTSVPMDHPHLNEPVAVDRISPHDLSLALYVNLPTSADEVVATADTIGAVVAYGLRLLADLIHRRYEAAT